MSGSARYPTLGVDCIGVGVGAVIVDGEGRLFIARRGPGARNERGKWEFPGGAVHFGETQVEALQREIGEEYGVDIEVLDLINVADHILPSEGQHWVSPGYLCRVRSGIPRIREPEKCSAISWVPCRDVGNYDLTVASRQTYEGFLDKFPDGYRPRPTKT